MLDVGGRDALCRSAALGLVFITLGSCRVLLIKFSANEDGKYEYLPVTVNMCAEVVKLLVCVALAVQYLIASGYKWRDVSCPSRHDFLGLVKWAVPGFLYFLDNLLAFYVVKYLQPAMAVLLGNFGIITTSVLFRIILKRKQSRVQWAALFILFLAIVCLSHQSQGSVSLARHQHHAVNHILAPPPTATPPTPTTPTPPGDTPPGLDPASLCHPEQTQFLVTNSTGSGKDVPPAPGTRAVVAGNPLLESGAVGGIGQGPWRIFQLHRGHAFVVLQCLISSLANVYNEKIFKEGGGMDESIYLQNCKLYAFGVVFNLLSLLAHRVYREKLWACGFFHGHNAFSAGLVFTTALYGLNVAFILKFRDNMFHLLSSQVITVIVISASIYFFHFQPQVDFFLTAPIVLTAIYVYQMSRIKEEQPADQAGQALRRRIRFMHDVDEGDGFIISQGPLQE